MPRNWSICCCGATDATLKSYSERFHCAFCTQCEPDCKVSIQPVLGMALAELPQRSLWETLLSSALSAPCSGLMQCERWSLGTGWFVDAPSNPSATVLLLMGTGISITVLIVFPQQRILSGYRSFSPLDLTAEISVSWK